MNRPYTAESPYSLTPTERIRTPRGSGRRGGRYGTNTDDDRYGETAAPPLTTIAQSPIDLGAEMARVLVRRLAGEPVERVTMMPTRLVPRASV